MKVEISQLQLTEKSCGIAKFLEGVLKESDFQFLFDSFILSSSRLLLCQQKWTFDIQYDIIIIF